MMKALCCLPLWLAIVLALTTVITATGHETSPKQEQEAELYKEHEQRFFAKRDTSLFNVDDLKKSDDSQLFSADSSDDNDIDWDELQWDGNEDDGEEELSSSNDDELLTSSEDDDDDDDEEDDEDDEEEDEVGDENDDEDEDDGDDDDGDEDDEDNDDDEEEEDDDDSDEQRSLKHHKGDDDEVDDEDGDEDGDDEDHKKKKDRKLDEDDDDDDDNNDDDENNDDDKDNDSDDDNDPIDDVIKHHSKKHSKKHHKQAKKHGKKHGKEKKKHGKANKSKKKSKKKPKKDKKKPKKAKKTKDAKNTNAKLNMFLTKINSLQKTWKAGKNAMLKLPAGTKKVLMACAHVDKSKKPRSLPKALLQDASDIPDSFDSREQWPDCAVTINYIRNQQTCGCCWSESVAGAITDRICIASGGKTTIPISAIDLQCCTQCMGGDDPQYCNGGNPLEAWQWYQNTGLVTGGDYESVGCKPFTMELALSRECVTTCTNPQYGKSYADDMNYGSGAFLVESNEQAIMAELMKYGPVAVTMAIFKDFMTYTGGVYIPTSNQLMGYHAVRLVGWGTDGGEPYWLIANSWSTGWGENGFFRITRTNNACGIMDLVTAGIPRLP